MADLPEVHSLEANLALPHPLEPALLLVGSRALPPAAALLVEVLPVGEARGGAAAERRLAEQRPRGAEHGARRRGHSCRVCGGTFAGAVRSCVFVSCRVFPPLTTSPRG